MRKRSYEVHHEGVKKQRVEVDGPSEVLPGSLLSSTNATCVGRVSLIKEIIPAVHVKMPIVHVAL